MEDNFIYAIKVLGVTKGFNRIYNKQLYIGKYKKENNIDVSLIDVTDFDGNVINKHSFPSSKRYGTLLGIEIQDVSSPTIRTGMPGSSDIILFNSFIEAKLQKLIDMKHIKTYFEEEIDKLKKRAQENMPKGIDELFKNYSEKFPEYLI